MSILIFLAALLVLLAQFAAWMAWRNLMIWQPVVAHMSLADYRETDERFDRHFGSMTNGNEGQRFTECWYRYHDTAGRLHEVQLTRIVQRGNFSRTAAMVWYDPENPKRATLNGPGTWALIAVVSLVALILLFSRGW
ncbi:MAG: hypothetical protein RL367_2008 [Pseudomonadota bacterium]|jgi:ABC-type nickel/cobalt efflux system permease component RcnA